MQPKLIATLVFAALVGLPLGAAAADKGGGPGAAPGKSDMPTSPPAGMIKEDTPGAQGSARKKEDTTTTQKQEKPRSWFMMGKKTRGNNRLDKHAV
jgi:hypothetical protein